MITKTQSAMLKDIIRAPYAWPGGYEKFAITDDGGVLCHTCCKDNFRMMLGAYRGDGWNIAAVDCMANVDDSELNTCDHCGKQF